MDNAFAREKINHVRICVCLHVVDGQAAKDSVIIAILFCYFNFSLRWSYWLLNFWIYNDKMCE